MLEQTRHILTRLWAGLVLKLAGGVQSAGQSLEGGGLEGGIAVQGGGDKPPGVGRDWPGGTGWLTFCSNRMCKLN